MIPSRKLDEAGAADSRRHRAALIKRHDCIVASMQHERWHIDARQQAADVNLTGGRHQADRVAGRRRLPLEIVEPANLFRRRVRHVEVREQLTIRRVVLTPAEAGKRHERLPARKLVRGASYRPTRGVGAVKSQRSHAIRVLDGVGDGDGSSLRDANALLSDAGASSPSPTPTPSS